MLSAFAATRRTCEETLIIQFWLHVNEGFEPEAIGLNLSSLVHICRIFGLSHFDSCARAASAWLLSCLGFIWIWKAEESSPAW